MSTGDESGASMRRSATARRHHPTEPKPYSRPDCCSSGRASQGSCRTTPLKVRTCDRQDMLIRQAAATMAAMLAKEEKKGGKPDLKGLWSVLGEGRQPHRATFLLGEDVDQLLALRDFPRLTDTVEVHRHARPWVTRPHLPHHTAKLRQSPGTAWRRLLERLAIMAGFVPSFVILTRMLLAQVDRLASVPDNEARADSAKAGVELQKRVVQPEPSCSS